MDLIGDEHVIKELDLIENSYTDLNWRYINLVRSTNDKSLNDQTKSKFVYVFNI